MTIVTRFAPSPTGLLHIGGARTALFNYIFAKSRKGVFKIRIEDTDKSRHIKDSVNTILKDLEWLGIVTEEKIIYQSQNKEKHIKFIDKMIEDGLAYKCYHSEEELNEKRKINKKFKSEWRYKKPRKVKPENFCVRIKSPENGVSIINRVFSPPDDENLNLDHIFKKRKKNIRIKKDNCFRNFFIEILKVIKEKKYNFYHKRMEQDLIFRSNLI